MFRVRRDQLFRSGNVASLYFYNPLDRSSKTTVCTFDAISRWFSFGEGHVVDRLTASHVPKGARDYRVC